MPKCGNSKSGGSAGILCCTVLMLCLATPAYCEQANSALMLESSPVNGGHINLTPGVYVFDRDSEITLSAVPNAGYRFVYWLGDVTDAVASSTVVCLNTPKIVIAVFERSEYAFVDLGGGGADDFATGSGPSAGGGMVRSGAESYSSDASPSEGKRSSHMTPSQPDFPVPTPEPATMVLLGAGSLLLAGYRSRRK